jgi:3-oxoacyl-[acyl-carrier protein] reductase
VDLSIKGKVALVTGAGHGIGAAIARALAEQGAQVALNYFRSGRSAGALAAALRRKGFQARAYRADIGDPLDVCTMTARIRSDLGPITILVNNAAVMLPGQPIERTTWRDFQAELNVALRGAFFCLQSAIEDMKKARWGRVINILAADIERPTAGHAAHIAAKSALAGLTRALAVELAPVGITVNAVSPGFTLTGSTARLKPSVLKRLAMMAPTRRLSRPEDIAQAVVFLAGAANITGHCITVDGGLSLVHPAAGNLPSPGLVEMGVGRDASSAIRRTGRLR